MPQEKTAYVVNVGGASVVSVVSVSHCNATDTTGCRTEAPSVPAHEATISADLATGTIYASNTSRPEIDVLNAATCRTGNLAGCTPVAEIPVGHPMANVSVADDITSHLAATVPVGAGPFGVAVNDRTHTVYVANNAFGDSPGTVSVINGATCNGTVTAGCSRRFPVMTTGVAPQLAAIDAATGTIYVTDFGSAGVTVLDGSRCNATVTSGCGASPSEQAVGSEPADLAIDPQGGTVYVINAFQAGSMSVLASDSGPHAS